MSDSENTDALIEAVSAAVPPLLGALEALQMAGRHLHPPQLQQLVDSLAGYKTPLVDGLAVLNAAAWPEHLTVFKQMIGDACAQALLGLDKFAAAPSRSNPTMAAYSALSYQVKAAEQLYPLTASFPPISRFFLPPSARDDEALLRRLHEADGNRDNVGIMHADNAGDQRGGLSIYVPEYFDGESSAPMPVVFALHGGSGHGRSFLWSWLRAARAHGAIVVSPTSADNTWSLMGPDVDTPRLNRMLEYVEQQWPVDPERKLLTGMSDGGTFSYVAGLQEDSPFTHLAPISASFHPMLLEVVEASRLTDLPIYITHGALDWMFPADVAQTAHQAFAAAGAQAQLEIIEDLSHTYPIEMSDKLLTWLKS